MNAADGRPIVVSELKDKGMDLWEILITTPDGVNHRCIVPGTILNVSGVQLTAAVIAELAANGTLPGRTRRNYG